LHCGIRVPEEQAAGKSFDAVSYLKEVDEAFELSNCPLMELKL
jgi:hypothetical protein